MKNLKIRIYFLYTSLAIVLFACCNCKNYKSYKSSKFELRQLIQETETKKTARASFFLIVGSYSKSEYKETKIKVFAKVDNRYRLIDMLIEDVRIAIDNKLKVPNIQIEYRHTKKLSDETLVSSTKYKVYVINCPEKYLPEKIIPIVL